VEKVAIVDIDAHQGNGPQEIFWCRGDVLYASVHIDPALGWYPHFVGHSDEVGEGAGASANLNVTIREGAGDDEWLAGLDRLVGATAAFGADAIVVSLGVDAASGDPNSPLEVTSDGFHEAGRRIGALGLPTVFVQEGGYDLPTLGPLVLEVLAGFEEEHHG
jgi:acetoin utilization deacetylase AcuC-like enzyme